ncbi:hypothetical protein [Lacticaseibacillus mingshuiensis]|uniref:Lactococcin 972 family bacteriocin n=1 Tax=Lacticaseibacillus mingshuiensis TaxID=2799574 RepID=A0ABW4CGL2_9LACO|nr:hypothetical protein [Lacticaseibacillus mingshuiensis]
MKKIFALFVVVFAIGLGGLSVVSSQSVGAATNKVVKSYHFDHNTTFNYNTNYTHYVYIRVPTAARYLDKQDVPIGSGWNYVRYQRSLYYTGGY